MIVTMQQNEKLNNWCSFHNRYDEFEQSYGPRKISQKEKAVENCKSSCTAAFLGGAGKKETGL